MTSPAGSATSSPVCHASTSGQHKRRSTVRKADQRRMLLCCDTCHHKGVHLASPDTILWHQQAGAHAIAASTAAACDMCGLDLRGPVQSHPGFVCFTCKADFKRAYKLVAHTAKHTGVKPIFCSLCPRNFTRRERLAEHLKSFHGQASQQAEQGQDESEEDGDSE